VTAGPRPRAPGAEVADRWPHGRRSSRLWAARSRWPQSDPDRGCAPNRSAAARAGAGAARPWAWPSLPLRWPEPGPAPRT
jgi:hypothetical protein